MDRGEKILKNNYMLDTVIKIGKLYRVAPNAHKYHEQMNSAWNDKLALQKRKDKDGNTIETVFYELPVTDENGTYSFDFENLAEIEDEDKQKQIHYLNFKTSKKDAEKRYLFGDIVYSHFKDNKNKLNEFGNYRLLGKWEKRTSFEGAEEVSELIDNKIIQGFRTAFRNEKERIESILKTAPSVVLHFKIAGKHWFQLNNLITDIDKIISANLVEKHESSGKYVLTKYLYKTLGGMAPGFNSKNAYKNKLFPLDDIISLMYATEVYQKPIIRINNLGIVALPYSDTITSEDIIEFFERERKTLKQEAGKEEQLLLEADDIFRPLVQNHFSEKVKFDIIFSSIPKSPAGVYSDLIEVSNIEKSQLIYIHEQIQTEKRNILDKIDVEFPDHPKPFSFNIRNSFLKILGDVTSDKKKYQSHLLKVLPQIYSGIYYQDPVLLPAFIEKVEYNIREGGQQFNTLKYDFYFLMNIQINPNLMKITETKSYALGKHLGIMARQFAAWRKDCPIKSFEKSYVGNLSRRITSIEDLVKFSGFLNEKLTIHDRLYPDVKDAYLQLVTTIDDFEGEKYNRHNCALGFFESYYGKTETKKEETNN
ncbi:MAG: hypothetical protein ACOCUT_01430 [bacterium]